MESNDITGISVVGGKSTQRRNAIYQNHREFLKRKRKKKKKKWAQNTKAAWISFDPRVRLSSWESPFRIMWEREVWKSFQCVTRCSD